MVLGRYVVIYCLLSLLIPPALAEQDDWTRVKVFSNDPVTLIGELERSNHDVLGINRKAGFVEILATLNFGSNITALAAPSPDRVTSTEGSS